MPHLLWLIVFENKLIPYKLAIIAIKLNKINFKKTKIFWNIATNK
jgi:hypothetical protein